MNKAGILRKLSTRGIPGLLRAEADSGRVLRLAFIPRFTYWINFLLFVVFPPLCVYYVREWSKPKPMIVHVNGETVVFPATSFEGEKSKNQESNGLRYLLYAGYALVAFIVLYEFRKQWVSLHIETGKGIWKRHLFGKTQSCAGADFLAIESRYGKTHSVRLAQTYAGFCALMPDEEIIELNCIFDYYEINLSQTMRQLLIDAGFHHETTTSLS